MIQQRVIRYIEKEHLFSPDDKLLVALSGGADSVALLRVLHTAGYQCEAAHCNFHLRGEESNRDEQFVRQLCQKYGIRLHTIDFNTTQYATEKRISIEMAARELRYNWQWDSLLVSAQEFSTECCKDIYNYVSKKFGEEKVMLWVHPPVRRSPRPARRALP